MRKVVCELILTIDMKARGLKSPAYYGYAGPQFMAWLKSSNEQRHQMLVGRKTYEMMNVLPDRERNGDGWKQTTSRAGFLFSSTLDRCDWPGLEVVHEDATEFVRNLKRSNGPEIRVLGSLSLVRQLVEAGLVDILRLMICPLVLPVSGIEPLFEEFRDLAFELAAHKVLDERILILDYRPAGAPPAT